MIYVGIILKLKSKYPVSVLELLECINMTFFSTFFEASKF